MRINKFVAQALGIARRQADDLISKGKINIDGQPAVLGNQITDQKVEYQGKVIRLAQAQYLMLNKPIGYVSSRAVQGENKTLYDLLPTDYHQLKPVGRLDKDSSGLILLTNDGDFSHRMTHPSFRKTKAYLVSIDKVLSTADKSKIEAGVRLDDGLSSLQLDGSETDWTVSMHEGRNRQIRRTFKALGYTVNKLHRTDFGKFTLESLQSGDWQLLDASVADNAEAETAD